jgi:hypothetical protein
LKVDGQTIGQLEGLVSRIIQRESQPEVSIDLEFQKFLRRNTSPHPRWEGSDGPAESCVPKRKRAGPTWFANRERTAMRHWPREVIGPEDLAMLHRVLRQTLPGSSTAIEREWLAAALIRIFQTGVTEEVDLVAKARREVEPKR